MRPASFRCLLFPPSIICSRRTLLPYSSFCLRLPIIIPYRFPHLMTVRCRVLPSHAHAYVALYRVTTLQCQTRRLCRLQHSSLTLPSSSTEVRNHCCPSFRRLPLPCANVAGLCVPGSEKIAGKHTACLCLLWLTTFTFVSNGQTPSNRPWP